ncbi:MAG: hypothetical protein JJU36_12665 [Phycisphaeraceae bacterium]|nr:hypothetical protein [Phycisphaeraceae bacterium]
MIRGDPGSQYGRDQVIPITAVQLWKPSAKMLCQDCKARGYRPSWCWKSASDVVFRTLTQVGVRPEPILGDAHFRFFDGKRDQMPEDHQLIGKTPPTGDEYHMNGGFHVLVRLIQKIAS